MTALDRFEQFFERIVEGTIMRFFRSPVQPAEIGRKLERAMEDGRMVSVGGTIVPNDYRVEMHPQDMLAFADFVLPLCRQMDGWLAEEIASHGYQTLDRVRVQISGNEAIPRRAIQVTARIVQGSSLSVAEEDAIQRTEVYRVIREKGGVPPRVLRLINGPGQNRVFTIRTATTTIGRALDNDLVLESTDVSRHHARIEYANGEYRIVDLGSTNGTRINSQPLQGGGGVLHDGDRIEFGALHLHFLPYQFGAAPAPGAAYGVPRGG